MLIQLIDGTGELQTVCWPSQETPTDRSAALTDPVAFQVLMAENTARAGWLFQNTSANSMLIDEVDAEEIASSWIVAPGASFPPPGYPVPTGQINVAGLKAGGSDPQIGDTFVAREW